MNQEWSQVLRRLYNDCRTLPKWRELVALHDEEDQKYFRMLDNLTGVKDDEAQNVEG